MASAFYISDSSGQIWQVGITTGGLLTTTAVSVAGSTPGVTPVGTYTPNDAVTFVKPMVKGIPISTIQAAACDMANSFIWTFRPWRWTLAQLTPINLVDGQQDYLHSQVDFHRLVSARVAQTNLSPVEYRELNMPSYIGVELSRKGGINLLTDVWFEPVSQKFRLSAAAAISGSTTIQLQGEYQRVPVKITNSNMSTALNLPDVYFQVFVDWLLYFLYKLADDPRAGAVSATSAQNTRTYSGQLAKAMDSLAAMNAVEDSGDGSDILFPDSTLALGTGNFGSYIFGI